MLILHMGIYMSQSDREDEEDSVGERAGEFVGVLREEGRLGLGEVLGPCGGRLHKVGKGGEVVVCEVGEDGKLEIAR